MIKYVWLVLLQALLGCASQACRPVETKLISKQIHSLLSQEKNVNSIELRKLLMLHNPDLRISRVMVEMAESSPHDPGLRLWISSSFPFKNVTSIQIEMSQDIISTFLNLLLNLLGLNQNPTLDLARAKYHKLEVRLENQLELLVAEYSVICAQRKKKAGELDIEMKEQKAIQWMADNLMLKDSARELRTCRDRVSKARQELYELCSALREKKSTIFRICGGVCEELD